MSEHKKVFPNLKVIEFQGLAPSVFIGGYFADCGADVVIIARHEQGAFSLPPETTMLNRNKSKKQKGDQIICSKGCICLNLTSKNDNQIIKHLVAQADVLIEPFRPGVLEKYGLGPKDLYKINPRIVMLRVSGYGQTGQDKMKPGHDLNYVSQSGLLSKYVDSVSGKPQFANNYIADFVGASLGITAALAALARRNQTGQGAEVDCSLMHATKYLASPIKDYKPDHITQVYKMGEQEIAATFSSQKQKQDFQANKLGKPLKDQGLNITKVLSFKNLPTYQSPIDYFNQGYIMKQDNRYGFTFTSPFTEARENRQPPFRGQHTVQVLKQFKVPQNLILQSLKTKPKL